jgi:hypothetical protein
MKMTESMMMTAGIITTAGIMNIIVAPGIMAPGMKTTDKVVIEIVEDIQNKTFHEGAR